MPEKIEEVLSELTSWYDELPGGTERPKLLSKLATLELCGWLEERFDSLARELAGSSGVDAEKSILERITKTHGFDYTDHVRGLFLAIGGEILVKRVESSLEVRHPGDLEQLKSELRSLWLQRRQLAHISSVTVPGRQVSINAPSWSQNRQRIFAKLISKLEAEFRTALAP